MAIRIPTAVRNAACDAVVDLADAGAGAATIEIRTGSQPATANDAATGSVLATIPCADPAFGSASSGTAALAGVPRSVTASGTGTAGWFRLKDSDGTTVLDGSVTATGGGGELTLATTSLSTGATVEITSGGISISGG